MIQMREWQLKREHHFVGYQLAEIFDFFSDASNLQAITPPYLHFNYLTPMPVKMEQGTLIDYRIRLMGIPVHWRTSIDVWQPPHRFVDRQLKGPYQLWYHEHVFEQLGPDVWMFDTVRYCPKGYFLAPLIQHLYVGRAVEKIFDFRSVRLSELFVPRQ